jgi:epoxyqueuosine reductase
MSKAIIAELHSRFEAIGRSTALCSTSRLEEVSRELTARYVAGEIASEIFQRYFAGFSYSPPATLPDANSLLLVAAPIGRSEIELDLELGPFVATIPPTYGAEEKIKEDETLLASFFNERRIAYARAWLPLKALAARAGLARYGRDNVLKFEGAGSFVRLDAWWTELEAEGEYWGEPRVLERCASCGACAKACPNDCFLGGRFLMDASKCLTFMNEGQTPFPSWVGHECHNAAVGCLLCQDACPENRDVPGRSVYRRFVLDRSASELLMAGRPLAELPASAAAAVRAAEMVGCEGRLARNLRALIEAKIVSSSPLA